MMKFFQKLGKSLMLPVACLPAAGILMGLGYILAPGVMAGAAVAELNGYATSGALYTIGFFLIKAGGALIDNMHWLFAIGVAVGMSDDGDGTAGYRGCAGWPAFRNHGGAGREVSRRDAARGLCPDGFHRIYSGGYRRGRYLYHRQRDEEVQRRVPVPHWK